MEKVHLVTLGCPKNVTDSELMLGALTSAGFEPTLDPALAQVLIVNTCAFIEAAKRESLDAIVEAAELKRRRGARLVVAGCLAQRYGKELAEQLPEVDIFVGTGNFLDLPELLRRTEAPEARPLPYPGAAHLLAGAEAPRLLSGDFFTAYLKVSEGCDHKCAFCIIPKIRGRHESRPPDSLIAEARSLAESGVKELNLIAQDLTAYGRDLVPRTSLAHLLERLDREVPALKWIRLLYCYPNFITDELLEAIADLPRVVKYIDMPLQHAHDDILRAMRRERSGSALSRLLERIRARIPGVTLRTSFIVGFPGETEEAFTALLDFVRREQFDRVGVFTYSREENTVAFDLPGQVPERVKRVRRAKLMEMQAQISLRRNRGIVGREMEVLVEGPMPGRATLMRGRNAGQAPEIDGSVFLKGEAEPGEFVRARVERALSYDLHARVIGANCSANYSGKVASHG